MSEGLYVNPVGPPAVPEECAGFRTSYMASHTWRDIEDALEIFARHRGDFVDIGRRAQPHHRAVDAELVRTLNA
jgi:hypothetical protein